jgi:hypothetical protein
VTRCPASRASSASPWWAGYSPSSAPTRECRQRRCRHTGGRDADTSDLNLLGLVGE